MFTSSEKTRYQKHLLLPQIGLEGQTKLKNASVLVVGAGGLGCPVLLYLTAAGVGKIGIIDNDTVDLSNLQRQVLYQTEDIGKPKVMVAASRLGQMNDSIVLEPINQKLKHDNAATLFPHYDIIVDCTDNFTTRYLINDCCVKYQKPFVYGAIHQFEGQVSVFNYRDTQGVLGPTYRCLFPEQPSELEIPNCAAIGVLGILPGTLGLYQANEVVKMITGIGKVLSGVFMMVDLLENTTQKIKVKRRADAEQLAQQEERNTPEMPTCQTQWDDTMTAEDLYEKLQNQEEIYLLDVRNIDEYEMCHLPDAILIPMNQVPNNIKRIPRDKPVVVYCHHGIRSASVIQYLEQNHQFNNLINLEGGINSWATDIDSSMPLY